MKKMKVGLLNLSLIALFVSCEPVREVEYVTQIERDYQIKINYSGDVDPIQAGVGSSVYFQTLNSRDLDRAAMLRAILEPEIRKYPRNFFKNMNISEIVLVKRLAVVFSGTYTPDGQTRAHYRYAVPDTYGVNFGDAYNPDYRKRLFISVYESDFCHYQECQNNNQIYDQTYLADTFHHELYHLVDAELNPSFPADSGWEALNSVFIQHSCEIGEDGTYVNVIECAESKQDPSVNYGTPSNRPGFITTYAETGPDEDKAEIFMMMMSTSKHDRIFDRIESDDVLDNKVDNLIGDVRSRVRSMTKNYIKVQHETRERTQVRSAAGL